MLNRNTSSLPDFRRWRRPRSRRLRLEQLELRRVLATFVVNTTDDFSDATAPGDGIVDVDLETPGAQISLRAAIEETNALPGPDDILFDVSPQDPRFVDIDFQLGLPGADRSPDVFVIQLTTVLPSLDDSSGGTTIDGFSQTLASGDVNPNGPEIVLDGLEAFIPDEGRVDGLVLESDGHAVFGLTIQNFIGSGIQIIGSDSIVAGNYLGSDATGRFANGNDNGLVVTGSNNTIGGTDLADVNVISGNSRAGILVLGDDNSIIGNFVGTTADGLNALSNTDAGVAVLAPARGNTIGGTATGEGNVIAFNGGAGVLVVDSDFSEASADNNAIRGNSIHTNGGLGIDLGRSFDADGVTDNDPGDEDTGPNQLQNFPVLEQAFSGPQTRIRGFVDGLPTTRFEIDFFASESADNSGHGEGQRYLGSETSTSDASGQAVFDVGLPAASLVEESITATITDAMGNTSEFSLAVAAQATASIAGRIVEDLRGDGFSDDDVPLAGIAIDVYRDNGDGVFNGGMPDDLASTATSFADGSYLVEFIEPGTYFVLPNLPSDAIITTPASGALLVALTSGELAAENDFGIFSAIAISGMKFDDRLGNGFSEDDLTIQGANLSLFVDGGNGIYDGGPDDELVETDITGSDGQYRFSGLGPGRYFVVETPPVGATQTAGGDSFPDVPFYTIDGLSGHVAEGRDFANFVLGAISGSVLEDVTGDGFTADDLPLADATVSLYRDDGDDEFSAAADPLVGQQTTDADGVYLFSELQPGRYYVVDSTAAGMMQTAGGDLFAEIPFYTVVAFSGVTESSRDFADARLPVLTGIVWNDENRDGIRDTGEARFGNSQVQLFDANGELLDETVSDAEGEYRFAGLLPGNYSVTWVVPQRHEPTYPSRRFDVADALAGGGIVSSAATADLNHDDAPDVIIVNDFENPATYDSSLLLLMNDGQGGFAERVTLPLDNYSRPQAVVAGDFDGDGDTDIAVATIGDFNAATIQGNAVVVFLNDGLGTFTPPVSYLAGDGPTDLAAGDVNGDGLTDLVTANVRSNDVSILLGDGAGAFAESARIEVGSQPLAVALADVDGNSTLDLAVGDFAANDVMVFSGGGDGSFALQSVLGNLDGPADVVWHDVNEDGQIDLVIPNHHSSQISIHLGAGNGQFADPVFYALVDRPRRVAIGDLNNDGDADITVAIPDAGAVSMLLGTGNGQFTTPIDFLVPAINFAAGISPHDVALGDYDLDGDTDIVAAEFVGGIGLLTNAIGSHQFEVRFGDVVALDFGGFLLASTVVEIPPAAPAGNVATPRHLDVNLDGSVSPLDALLVINLLGKEMVDSPSNLVLQTAADVNGDNAVTPLDALHIINYLDNFSDASVHQSARQSKASLSSSPGEQISGLKISLREATVSDAVIVGRSVVMPVFLESPYETNEAANRADVSLLSEREETWREDVVDEILSQYVADANDRPRLSYSKVSRTGNSIAEGPWTDVSSKVLTSSTELALKDSATDEA